MSKKDLLKKLENPEYRQEFLTSEIEIGLPTQIRAMREQRGWKQSFVAAETATKQPRFSLMEKPGYGSFSLNTLKKLASLFDVGLIVSFVPWGEMIDFAESISRRRLNIPSFKEDRRCLTTAYLKDHRHTTGLNDRQLSLCFSTVSAITGPVESTASLYVQAGISNNPVQIEPEIVANAHLATIILQGSEIYVNAR